MCRRTLQCNRYNSRSYARINSKFIIFYVFEKKRKKKEKKEGTD